MHVIQAVFGLLFVIGLLYVILKLLQKYTNNTIIVSNKDRAVITGITYIDNSTKIVSAMHGPSKYVFVVGKYSHLLLDKYENREQN